MHPIRPSIQGQGVSRATSVAGSLRPAFRLPTVPWRAAPRRALLPSGPMPITIARNRPSLLIRRTSFERVGLVRAEFDAHLNLTPDEFRVEGDLIVVGPVHDDDAFGGLVADLESRGLRFFDDMFELSGNWPEWLTLYARGD